MNPPYYGNIIVNAAIGAAPGTVIAPLELDNTNDDPRVSAYVLHDFGGEKLSRVVILNLRKWNSTTAGARPVLAVTQTAPTGVHGARTILSSMTYENIG